MAVSRALSATATGTLHTGAGVLTGALLCAGSDAATLTVYDNTTNSGTVLCKLGAAATLPVSWEAPGDGLTYTVGLHAVLSGTSPTGVCFRKESGGGAR